MVLNVFIVAVVILALIMVLFFLFSLLLPAMKNASFSVDAPMFSKSEMSVEDAQDNQKESILTTDERAFIACGACSHCDEETFVFDKTHSCRTLHEVCLSLSDCDTMCIGSGDCAAVCPQRAIVIKKYGRRNCAVVTDLCCGCKKCVDVCPQGIIKMVSKEEAASFCASEKQAISIERSNVFGFLRGGI